MIPIFPLRLLTFLLLFFSTEAQREKLFDNTSPPSFTTASSSPSIVTLIPSSSSTTNNIVQPPESTKDTNITLSILPFHLTLTFPPSTDSSQFNYDLLGQITRHHLSTHFQENWQNGQFRTLDMSLSPYPSTRRQRQRRRRQRRLLGRRLESEPNVVIYTYISGNVTLSNDLSSNNNIHEIQKEAFQNSPFLEFYVEIQSSEDSILKSIQTLSVTYEPPKIRTSKSAGQDSPPSSSSPSWMIILIAILVGSMVAIIIGAGFILITKRRIKRQQKKEGSNADKKTTGSSAAPPSQRSSSQYSNSIIDEFKSDYSSHSYSYSLDGRSLRERKYYNGLEYLDEEKEKQFGGDEDSTWSGGPGKMISIEVPEETETNRADLDKALALIPFQPAGRSFRREDDDAQDESTIWTFENIGRDRLDSGFESSKDRADKPAGRCLRREEDESTIWTLENIGRDRLDSSGYENLRDRADSAGLKSDFGDEGRNSRVTFEFAEECRGLGLCRQKSTKSNMSSISGGSLTSDSTEKEEEEEVLLGEEETTAETLEEKEKLPRLKSGRQVPVLAPSGSEELSEQHFITDDVSMDSIDKPLRSRSQTRIEALLTPPSSPCPPISIPLTPPPNQQSYPTIRSITPIGDQKRSYAFSPSSATPVISNSYSTRYTTTQQPEDTNINNKRPPYFYSTPPASPKSSLPYFPKKLSTREEHNKKLPPHLGMNSITNLPDTPRHRNSSAAPPTAAPAIVTPSNRINNIPNPPVYYSPRTRSVSPTTTTTNSSNITPQVENKSTRQLQLSLNYRHRPPIRQDNRVVIIDAPFDEAIHHHRQNSSKSLENEEDDSQSIGNGSSVESTDSSSAPAVLEDLDKLRRMLKERRQMERMGSRESVKSGMSGTSGG